MFILKSSLYSHEKWNQKLTKYYNNGYTMRSDHKSFIVMSKHNGPRYYFNVTAPSRIDNVHSVASTDSFTAYISETMSDLDINALAKYYDAIITSHNSTTFKLLVPIVFLIICYDFIPVVLKPITTGIIFMIFIIAFLRNITRKLFISNTVKPHTLKYNLDNELLSKVYIVKALNPLSAESLTLIAECGKVSKVKQKDGFHNYKLESILERTEIMDIINSSPQTIEVFSTEFTN